ncbi:T3SS effector HopA1 family protein [Streptomyces canarius]
MPNTLSTPHARGARRHVRALELSRVPQVNELLDTLGLGRLREAGAEGAGGRRAALQGQAASVPHQYPRYDAVVVYLAAEDRALADLVAREVEGHPALGEETSLFARRHAPGLASAAEPGDPRPGMRGMSFGQHRSHVMAQALVEHATTGRGEPLDLLLARRLAEASIDPSDPSRNLAA